MKDHLLNLKKTGIIQDSSSPWASPVVLVRKKNGELRLCVDYRQLNKRTIKDSYALPRIDELMDHFSGCKYFSSLDLRSGYYQVEIEETDKEKTAFTVGTNGFYEFIRMPFGLSNSPATFQRLMAQCMGDLYMKICFAFLDDINVPGKNFEECLDRLTQVFQKLRVHNLKLNGKKCHFFKTKLLYCGHIISEMGIETDPDKIAKVANWPVPSNAKAVREFLGFAGYYRRFVSNFAQMAKPLYALIGGAQGKKGNKKSRVSPPPWVWGKTEQDAFEAIKTTLTSPPLLAYAHYDMPFILHTDASGNGLGAVLSQMQDGTEHVIAYASRGLSKAEKNYSAHKLEFLALKWAVTEKFTDYLYGAKHQSIVLTDNNPLTYVLTSAKLDATGHRWLAALAAYDLVIKYRPGKHNSNADALSRLPDRNDEERQEIDSETIRAITCALAGLPLVESLSISAELQLDIGLDNEDFVGNIRETRKCQAEDQNINTILKMIRESKIPNLHLMRPGTELYQLCKNFDKLKIKRGLLGRVTYVDGEDRWQVVLPKSLRKRVLDSLHNQAGHQCRDRTLSLVQDRCYWPGMWRDIDVKIKTCERCIKRRGNTNIKAPLVSITTSQPLELVCIDFLSLEPSKGGFENVLVITDHFTRYALAIPTKDQSARTTAETLFNGFIVHYGIPMTLFSDQGQNFNGKVINELCRIMGMKKSRTTIYHPSGNGMCERLNRTIMNMLGTLDSDQKKDWKRHIGAMVHAYNATRHTSTGHSPFYLMFGRQARLPVDLLFEDPENEGKSYGKYVSELRDRIKKAYNLASESARKSQVRQKQNYDIRARAAVLEAGDRVLVKILAFEGRHKLANKWEDGVYTVLEQPNKDVPVYNVQLEDRTGPKRKLHRNHLLPVNHLPIETTPPPVAAPRKRLPPKPAPRKAVLEDTSSESDSDVEQIVDIQVNNDDVHSASEVSEVLSIDVSNSSEEETSVGTSSGQENDPVDIAHAAPKPPDVPRRSGRQRKLPIRLRDDYVMYRQAVKDSQSVDENIVGKQQQPIKSDWAQRASFLASISSSVIFQGRAEHLSQAILEIVTKH